MCVVKSLSIPPLLTQRSPLLSLHICIQSGCAEVAVSVDAPEPVILFNSPMLDSSVDDNGTTDTQEVAVAKQPEPSAALEPGTFPVTAKLASVELPWDALMSGGCFNVDMYVF